MMVEKRATARKKLMTKNQETKKKMEKEKRKTKIATNFHFFYLGLQLKWLFLS
jgi:hypothetical protein